MKNVLLQKVKLILISLAAVKYVRVLQSQYNFFKILL